jgi:hypothetical protein
MKPTRVLASEITNTIAELRRMLPTVSAVERKVIRASITELREAQARLPSVKRPTPVKGGMKETLDKWVAEMASKKSKAKKEDTKEKDAGMITQADFDLAYEALNLAMSQLRRAADDAEPAEKAPAEDSKSDDSADDTADESDEAEESSDDSAGDDEDFGESSDEEAPASDDGDTEEAPSDEGDGEPIQMKDDEGSEGDEDMGEEAPSDDDGEAPMDEGEMPDEEAEEPPPVEDFEPSEVAEDTEIPEDTEFESSESDEEIIEEDEDLGEEDESESAADDTEEGAIVSRSARLRARFAAFRAARSAEQAAFSALPMTETDFADYLSTDRYHAVVNAMTVEERIECRQFESNNNRLSAAKRMTPKDAKEMEKSGEKNRKARKYRSAWKTSPGKGKKGAVNTKSGTKTVYKKYYFSMYDKNGKYLGSYWSASKSVDPKSLSDYRKTHGTNHPAQLPVVDPQKKFGAKKKKAPAK